MPTYERRFFLNMYIKENKEREEKLEELKEQNTQSVTNSKGSRQKKVSGETLKAQMKNGMIPLQ